MSTADNDSILNTQIYNGMKYEMSFIRDHTSSIRQQHQVDGGREEPGDSKTIQIQLRNDSQ